MQIKELTLFSKNLDLQVEFYRDIIGFSSIENTGVSAKIAIGTTILQFVQNDEMTPYHFAFDIPSNKLYEAYAWLKERVSILGFEGKEIIDFPAWNAHAIYFYDPDQNIGELIARHNRGIYKNQLFDPSHIVGISEIGIPVNDIESVHNFFHKLFDIQIYSGDYSRFCALGDEEGLFIVIDKKTKPDWFPTGDTALCSEFMAKIEYEGKVFEIGFKKEILRLLK
ncbi:MAG: VOC family protein [Bacteroidota bacterium]